MRASLIGILCLLLVACSVDRGPANGQQALRGVDARSGSVPSIAVAAAPAARRSIGIASLPDRGELVGYDRVRGSATHGAYTWHPVQLSEAHAIRAIAQGELRLTAPDGRVIRLRYDHHVEHTDGNWTWVGREPGAKPGTEAIITFGEKAVFGSIPDGAGPPLRLAMSAGRSWLVQTDPAAAARLQGSRRPQAPDFLLPPKLGSLPGKVGAASPSTPPAHPAAATATAATSVVDLVIGYTNGFASRLGGRSQAVTRLTFMVDVANQAYANSQVDARLRVIHAMQVSYADATANDEALYDVTGVDCTESGGGLSCEYVGPPASLQPLHDAREQFGGDLVSLVRKFSDPENEGCGVAWVNGGGQQGMSHDSEITGFSVVSDSSGNEFPEGEFICRDESLAHELGHNMGSAHDRDTADGDDNVLQGNEYGAYAYSFGHKNLAAAFYTVMAYGDEGQQSYRVFSNPSITYCGGHACGVANQADNARSLRQAIPIVAAFRATTDTGVSLGNHFSGDFNGDGKSDILWYNQLTGASTLWRSGNRSTRQALWTVADLDWRIVAVGDFGGDGKSDIFWNNRNTGANTVWKSADRSTRQTLPSTSSVNWQVAGAGDFNGDAKSDILWRNRATGANSIWLSANKATPRSLSSSDLNMKVAGIGDFNGDGKDDILWRNVVTGANAIWRSASTGSIQAVDSVTDLAWQLAGVGDYDGDARADIFWRNTATGANVVWRSANRSLRREMSSVTDVQWRVASSGDFNGDGDADILWRNFATGANTIWRSGSRDGYLNAADVADVNWVVAP